MAPPRAPVPHLSHPTQQRRAKTPLGRLTEAVSGQLFSLFAVLGVVAVLVASTLQMAGPGVTVLTGATPGNSAQLRTSSGTYFAVGLLERGDTTAPILVTSAAELIEKTGSRQAYGALYDNLITAFAEGLRRAYIVQYAHDGARGRHAAPDGSPGSTFSLDDPARQFPVLRDGAPVAPPPVG